jgi:rod shape determining protein RodA
MAGLSTPVVRANSDRSSLRLDWGLILAAAFLISIGLSSLISVGDTKDGSAQKQITWLVLGIVPFSAFFFIHPRVWERLSNWLYFANLAMLSFVLVVGRSAGGAQRWIEVGGFQFQPSEMSKILVALTLAAFLAKRIDRIHSLSTFALSFLHVLPPLILIYKQPHLGATLSIVVIWLSICIASGVPLKFVSGAGVAAILLVVAAYFIPGAMDDYQRDRIDGLFHHDEKGISLQTDRAEVAFGAGGLYGVGYGNGEQKRGGFIPKQSTDFIFTVIGEEGGLVGTTLVLCGFGLFFLRAWLIMFRATDEYYKMAAAGILAMLAFHTVANMGMNLKLLPVVGLWLPFMSYGGTAIWLCLCCVGLLLNIRRHERPVLF